MSKSNKNKHYSLAQLKELRKEFKEMSDKWEKDPRAVMAHKAKLREQQVRDSMQEWESIKRESKQLRLI